MRDKGMLKEHLVTHRRKLLWLPVETPLHIRGLYE